MLDVVRCKLQRQKETHAEDCNLSNRNSGFTLLAPSRICSLPSAENWAYLFSFIGDLVTVEAQLPAGRIRCLRTNNTGLTFPVEYTVQCMLNRSQKRPATKQDCICCVEAGCQILFMKKPNNRDCWRGGTVFCLLIITTCCKVKPQKGHKTQQQIVYIKKKTYPTQVLGGKY